MLKTSLMHPFLSASELSKILSNQLKPGWKTLRGFRAKDKHIRAQQKRNFDKRHCVRYFPFLHSNTYAWIDTPTSGRHSGVVQLSHHTFRSCIVKTESNACSSLRRNRRHLGTIAFTN